MTVNKKINLYIKASVFQFCCSGTPRHKYEIRFAVYDTHNQSCIPMCKMKSKCRYRSNSGEEVRGFWFRKTERTESAKSEEGIGYCNLHDSSTPCRVTSLH